MQSLLAAPDLLLAMDTSGDLCSMALFRGGQLAAEHIFRHEMHLSERLIGYVDAMLGGLTVTIHEIDCFAVGIGPGSFTGTRIGVMTMKTFAFIQSKPIVTLNALETMAAEYCGLRDVIVTPVLACRSGTVYACPYSVEAEAPTPLAEPAAYSFSELGSVLHGLEARTLLFCGPAAGRYKSEIRVGLGELRAASAAFGLVSFPRASTVGRFALSRLASGLPPAVALEIVPLYISPPPITLPKQQVPL